MRQPLQEITWSEMEKEVLAVVRLHQQRVDAADCCFFKHSSQAG